MRDQLKDYHCCRQAWDRIASIGSTAYGMESDPGFARTRSGRSHFTTLLDLLPEPWPAPPPESHEPFGSCKFKDPAPDPKAKAKAKAVFSLFAGLPSPIGMAT